MPKRKRKAIRCQGPGCRVRFTPTRAGQRFHSDRCRHRNWTAGRRRVYLPLGMGDDDPVG